ncbi:hypothetical protein AB0I81_49305 [Nonomuraea sp. NPDC050404]|uniref:hypothetical protein n=1 Tax=Nonomuraea sp. NPDC050404 TaxID=3155783 RepID=UPI003411A20F
MGYFSYEKSPRVRLPKLTLFVGQEAPPIMWQDDRPGENPFTAMLFQQDYTHLRVEEIRPVGGQSSTNRLLQCTGTAPGSGRVEAMDVPRTGADQPLGRLDYEVLDNQTADLVYTGKLIHWRNSVPATLKTPLPLLFSASSGAEGHQFGRQQFLENEGPLPEGLYTFLTHVDPEQNSVKAANKLGERAVTNNYRQGIQFLPMDGSVPKYPAWGTMRVRLTQIKGDTLGRPGGYFLHNSQKGYSHGCIEVGKTAGGVDFFNALLIHARSPARRPKLTVLVTYSYPEQSTRGKTKVSE